MNYLKRQTAINELVQFGLESQKRLERCELRRQEAAELEAGIDLQQSVTSLSDAHVARLQQARQKRAEAAQLLATATADLTANADTGGRYKPVYDAIRRLADAGDPVGLQQQALIDAIQGDLQALIETAKGM